ncbi:MAG: hypothetical protein M0017_01985 [Desulfobacteraceae bacterium]|nr:hypothetical protein [Desulfobacteraceae bacterium]
MDTEQVREASWVVQSVAGASAYLHGVDYPRAKFMAELGRMVAHIKEPATVSV